MRSCPDCAKPMQPFHVRLPADQPEVQLDRCAECGGLWFGFGELDRIAGRVVPYELLHGETSRRCPDCTMSLTPVLLERGIPVETCSTCRGMWFDFSDLEQFGKPLAAPPPPAAARYDGVMPPDEPASTSSRMGFDCAKCGKRTPFAQGNATSKGLVCGDCVPKIQPPPKLTRPDGSRPVGAFQVADLIDVLRGLFR